jgi:hypothetical protein
MWQVIGHDLAINVLIVNYVFKQDVKFRYRLLSFPCPMEGLNPN